MLVLVWFISFLIVIASGIGLVIATSKGLPTQKVSIVLALSLLASCASFFSIGKSEPSDASRSEGASSTVDEHAARQQAQTFWNGVMTPLAFSGEYVALAGRAMEANDSVAAQQYLSEAQKYLQKAGDGNLESKPDGDEWNKISDDLDEALFAYKGAVSEVKDGLDAGSSKTLADALDEAAQARQPLDEATHLARVWYIAHGGTGSDLADYDANVAALDKMLKTLSSQNQ